MVGVLNEVVDSGDKVFDAAEAAAADGLLGNETEPALDLIEPGSVGGSVVHVKAGPLGQPEAHLGMLVSRVVVDDQMNVQLWGHRLVDALEKAEKLLMTVTRLALGNDRAAGDIEGGQQCRGAVADIVMGDAFHVFQAHRQHRLGTIERLDLRLFIDRKHDGMIGRIQIESHHIAHLFDEEGITGKLEVSVCGEAERRRPGRSCARWTWTDHLNQLPAGCSSGFLRAASSSTCAGEGVRPSHPRPSVADRAGVHRTDPAGFLCNSALLELTQFKIDAELRLANGRVQLGETLLLECPA